ncbi:hypothetical protein BIW11_12005 [Tropilaelaps mercedesae]|uniref:Transmembrane protein n=1 Tax=Tropilaelaps mercedesae TaxID=418985 RepID=A0A1V9X8J0_9ACAR|nr:hypothetical protein BIW11_12005 [Tropilaelaps mercedesae]
MDGVDARSSRGKGNPPQLQGMNERQSVRQNQRDQGFPRWVIVSEQRTPNDDDPFVSAPSYRHQTGPFGGKMNHRDPTTKVYYTPSERRYLRGSPTNRNAFLISGGFVFLSTIVGAVICLTTRPDNACLQKARSLKPLPGPVVQLVDESATDESRHERLKEELRQVKDLLIDDFQRPFKLLKAWLTKKNE